MLATSLNKVGKSIDRADQRSIVMAEDYARRPLSQLSKTDIER